MRDNLSRLLPETELIWGIARPCSKSWLARRGETYLIQIQKEASHGKELSN